MKKIILYGLLTILAISSFAQTDYLPVGATVKKLSTDQFFFLEGPVWYEDSVLLFSDIGTSPTKIHKYSPQSKTFSVFRDNSQKTNGLTCSKEGILLGCEQTTKRIVSLNRNGNVIQALATTFNGNAYNGPNDLIADSKGGIYFTDPKNPYSAVYYLSPAGLVSKIITNLITPNGILLSPDGSKLYVCDTRNKYLYSYNVSEDGSISGRVILNTLKTIAGEDSISKADGMAIDIHGNIYVTSEVGVQVVSKTGAYLGTITLPEIPANCDFGGKDMKTLYITATKNLYSIDLNYPGYTVLKSLPNTVRGGNLQNAVFSLFPVPADEWIEYKLNSYSKHEIGVYNSIGKCIKRIYETGNSGVISTLDLPDGVYFAKFTSSDLSYLNNAKRFIVAH